MSETMTERRTGATASTIDVVETYAAHNYHPLPVVISDAEGCWVTDVAGRRYLDCVAAYSALNFGHHNSVVVDAVKRQLDRVTLFSSVFHHDVLGPFAQALAHLAAKDMVLPMNPGAE